MRRSIYSIVSVTLVAASFAVGAWHAQDDSPGAGSSRGRRILYYVDPMHPDYKSHKPGVAPDCGMALEPIYSEDASAETPASFERLKVAAVRSDGQQLTGVHISPVEETAATRTLRLFGRVAPDETRVYSVNAGVDGYLREVSAVATGTHVEKNQWLATFSAPELRQPLQSFLVTLGIQDRGRQSGDDSPAQIIANNGASQVASDRLLNLGMSAIQLDEIRRTREAATDIRILAPAAGFVIARDASPGQKFTRGTEWYRIADLREVWILADVLENDVQYLRPGARVEVAVPGRGTTRPARVASVLPQFDPATRKLKVRLEATNPDYTLRPDMFVNVEVSIAMPPAVTVPTDAIVDTGLAKTVFVERGAGTFEPRQITTGSRVGDRVIVEKGLTAGERIVVSGTFLVDSDTRTRVSSVADEP